MLSFLAVLLLGFVLGVRHAADPDHVVAVSTIVTRSRSLARAAAVGALWGVGHTATILLVGGAIILFKITITPRMGLAMELAVAAMLIGLGLVNLVGRPAADDAAFAPLRPVAIGFVHGLAGSAAIALLVLTTIDDARWSAAYLVIFGAGTVAGMMVITAAIAVPLRFASHRVHGLQRHLRVASGALSVALGLFLVHQIGIVDGLFTGDPTWTPH
jgi:high-affinity nickel-transport protein